MRELVSCTFEFHLNVNDPDLVPIPLRLPDCMVAQMDAAMEILPTIRTRAEFAEYAILWALNTLNQDAAGIWIGDD